MSKPIDWASLLGQQVRENSRRFFRLACNIVRDPVEAEDICQTAFAKAWSAQSAIQDSAALKAWLLSTVANEALQCARRRKTEQRLLGNRAGHSEEDMAPSERAALKEAVRNALLTLPEQTRLVVVLRVMQGMSGNEVASSLSCSPSEVSRRLYEGLEKLRASLADWGVVVEDTSHGL